MSNKKSPAKSARRAPTKAPYKNHRAGSRKGFVHKAFDNNGAEAALMIAQRAGIKVASCRSWMSSWRKAEPKKAPARKAAPKAKKAA